MTITISMPSGGDEKIKPASVLIVRDPLDYEKDESPEVQSTLIGRGYRIYPAVPTNDLVQMIESSNSMSVKLLRLTAPNGNPIFVNARAVTDRDARSAIVDHEETNSVLLFGPGANAGRVKVRETKQDLLAIWEKFGLDTTPLT